MSNSFNRRASQNNSPFHSYGIAIISILFVRNCNRSHFILMGLPSLIAKKFLGIWRNYFLQEINFLNFRKFFLWIVFWKACLDFLSTTPPLPLLKHTYITLYKASLPRIFKTFTEDDHEILA